MAVTLSKLPKSLSNISPRTTKVGSYWNLESSCEQMKGNEKKKMVRHACINLISEIVKYMYTDFNCAILHYVCSFEIQIIQLQYKPTFLFRFQNRSSDWKRLNIKHFQVSNHWEDQCCRHARKIENFVNLVSGSGKNCNDLIIPI